MFKSKGEAFGAFKKVMTCAEREVADKLKVFHNDHGGEFMSKAFIEHCEKLRIKRHLTTPYSP